MLQEFLAESYENLDRLDRELVELEKTPDDERILSSIFRTIHTIKGTSGFFGFSKLGELTHVGENLLSKMRDGELRIDSDIASALLQMVDAVREMLASIGACHDEGEGDYSAIAARLAQLLAGQATATATATATAAAPPPLVAVTPASPAAAAVAPSVVASSVAPATTAAAEPTPATKPAAPIPEERRAAPAASEPVAESSIRVDTMVLDDLMNLAGEMVLARNELMQIAGRVHDPALAATCQRLSLITAQMQEGVMRTRMQPIGNLLAKLPRVVRDLAVTCGKEVAIELEGKETDLDRTVLEAIKDPLTHLIRNAVDHGIETPAVRLRAGKPAQGTLRVRAFHAGGQVHIEIIDDGAGIDAERVKQKALDRGLISAAEARQMSDRDAVSLIFLPGLSTAEKVTNVSGRGVGMDVVKTNVQRIGGHIDVQSTRGVGTCLRIRIPLTLAIIPALIVTCGGDRYAIPQLNVRELVRIERDAERVIEHIHDAPVHRLRGQLLPLVDLAQLLGCAAPDQSGPIHVVVIDIEGRAFGLVVDQIKDTDEIVVKPLERQMKGVGPYAGATILGDGRVSLILDARALAERAHMLGAGREAVAADAVAVDLTHPVQTLLVIEVGEGRAALPLAEVARLEEFASTAIERAGGREVVQYRGRVLPLLRMADALALPETRAASLLQVVVHTDAAGESFGLVVDGIVDVVQEAVALQPGARVAGVLGTAIVHERATELLDVGGLLRSAGLGGM